MSRLIVKNLPHGAKEENLRKHFDKFGTITDCSLKFTKDGQFRRFAFIGYKTAKEADAALVHCNNTFINTSKIQVEIAKDFGDGSKSCAWSKYSKINSKCETTDDEIPIDSNADNKNKQEKKKKEENAVVNVLLGELKDDLKFQEFLETHSNVAAKPVWSNDGVKTGVGDKTKNALHFADSSVEAIGELDENDQQTLTVEDEEEQVTDATAMKQKMSDLDYLRTKVVDQQLFSDSESDNEPAESDVVSCSKAHRKRKDESTVQNHPDQTEKVESSTVYILELKGLPSSCGEKAVREFFMPIDVVEMKIPQNAKKKPLGVAHIVFHTEKDLEQALRKNKNFIGGKRVYLRRGKPEQTSDGPVKKSRDWELKLQTEDKSDAEGIIETGRLFVRNLSYDCTEEDLEEEFKKYGSLTEVSLPVDYLTKKVKGFAFLTYMMPEHALKAYAELDGKVFQGRMMHILPGKEKKEETEKNAEKSSYKKEKERKQKALAGSSHNWNTLFLGANTVADVLAEKYGTSKRDILDSALEMKPDYQQCPLLRSKRHFQVGNTEDSLTDAETTLMENPQKFKKFVWVKRCQGIPANVMWPGSVMQSDGEYINVYIKSDNAVLRVKKANTVPFALSSVESYWNKFQGILQKKKRSNALKELKKDIDHIKNLSSGSSNTDFDPIPSTGGTLETEKIKSCDETEETHQIVEQKTKEMQGLQYVDSGCANTDPSTDSEIESSDKEKDRNKKREKSPEGAYFGSVLSGGTLESQKKNSGDETEDTCQLAEAMDDDIDLNMFVEEMAEEMKGLQNVDSGCANTDPSTDSETEYSDKEEDRNKKREKSPEGAYFGSVLSGGTLESQKKKSGDETEDTCQLAEAMDDDIDLNMFVEEMAEEMKGLQKVDSGCANTDPSTDSETESSDEEKDRNKKREKSPEGVLCDTVLSGGILESQKKTEETHPLAEIDDDDLDPDYIPSTDSETEYSDKEEDRNKKREKSPEGAYFGSVLSGGTLESQKKKSGDETEDTCQLAEAIDDDIDLNMFVEEMAEEMKGLQKVDKDEDQTTPQDRGLGEESILRDKVEPGIFIKRFVKTNRGKGNHTKETERPYDTAHACRYCNNLFTHIQSHLENKHRNEKDVALKINLLVNHFEDTKGSLGVRIALGETQIVSETRDFLLQNGVSLDSFSQANAPRSKTVLLAKNLPAKTAVLDIRSLFSQYGTLGRVLLPPSGITAIIEFVVPSEARMAFTKLAYIKFQHVPLYLEWAPVEIFNTEAQLEQASQDHINTSSKSSVIEIDDSEKQSEDVSIGSTLFVKNLNFNTTDKQLQELFDGCGKIRSAKVARKKDTKIAGENLSMGYGFVEFASPKGAEKAVKELQYVQLDSHKLELKISHRASAGIKSHSSRHTKQGEQEQQTKILVRNIPFEAKRGEIEELFKVFGELTSVRLPKKLSGTGSHRGFAFVDFLTKQDAKRAFEALCHSTHLFGRRLVLEWAKVQDDIDDIRKRTTDHFHEEVAKKSFTKASLKESLEIAMDL